MAQYELIEPSIEKLEELAMITHNLMLFTEAWEKAYKVPDKESMHYWRGRAKAWLDHNRKKSPNG